MHHHLLGDPVGLLWSWVADTAWGSLVDAGTAGERFVSPLEPVRMVAGSLLVAVPAVLLVRSGWSWFEREILGRERAVRIPGELR